MTEKKSNWVTKLLPENLKSVLWTVIGAFVGIFLLQPLSDRFYQRAEISAKVQSLTFSNEIGMAEWELTLVVRLANTGSRPLVIEYRNINLYMPSLAESEYSFDIKQTKMVKGNAVMYDTVITYIPKLFNEPKFKSGSVDIYSPDNSHLTTTVFDSSNVGLYLFYNSVTKPLEEVLIERPDILEGIKYDAATRSVRINFDKYYINYRGQVYENSVYAPGTKITHKIVGDKIRLSYLKSGSSQRIGGRSVITHVSPSPIFIPHKLIRDKVEFPKKVEIQVTRQYEENGVLKTKYHKITMKENTTQFFYAFKN